MVCAETAQKRVQIVSNPENAILLIEKDMDRVELHSFAGGEVACFSRRCPGKETPNEDAAALIPYRDGGVLLVADGAGGARGGAQASSTMVYEMIASLEQAQGADRSLREAILDGIESANREIYTLAIGAATTAAAAELGGGAVRPYHVGDSGLLLAGQKGKLKFQSISHSPIGYALESGYLGEHEALFHEDRHLVSNVVGIPEMHIQLGSAIELSSRDSLLLGSDGLFDNLTLDEIVQTLRKGTLEESTQSLVDAATVRMLSSSTANPSKPDDLTVIVYRPEG